MRLRSLLVPGLFTVALLAACGGDDAIVAPKAKAGASGADSSQAGTAGASANGGTTGAGATTGGGASGTAGAGGGTSGGAAGSTAQAGTDGGSGSSAGGSPAAGAAGAAGSGTAGNGTAGNGTAGNGTAGTQAAGAGGTNAAGSSGAAGSGAGGSPEPVCNPSCGDGFQCVNGTCVLGSTCGREDIAVTRTPPNVLLSLDRSCSMTKQASGVVKWTAAVGAMTSFTKTFDKQVRFGLELFPDTDDKNSCKMLDPLQVPIGANKATAIGTLLTNALDKNDKYYPNGPCTTPIDFAAEKAETEPALNDGKHPGFFVLITDGAQTNCGGTGDKGTTAAITNMKKKGIGTFVISFGTGTGIDVAQLNVWAEAGGYPNNADNDPKIQFYQAGDQAQLNAALTTIAEAAVSCDFALGKMPPDLDKLFVFEDLTDQVARDPKHANGWDYDAAKNAVTLYGQHCTDLKKGVTKEVNVVYGCPGGGGSTELCASGKPKCDKDHLCPPDNGATGLCLEGCCSYTKD
jgi:hypothetical protein